MSGPQVIPTTLHTHAPLPAVRAPGDDLGQLARDAKPGDLVDRLRQQDANVLRTRAVQGLAGGQYNQSAHGRYRWEWECSTQATLGHGPGACW